MAIKYAIDGFFMNMLNAHNVECQSSRIFPNVLKAGSKSVPFDSARSLSELDVKHFDTIAKQEVFCNFVNCLLEGSGIGISELPDSRSVVDCDGNITEFTICQLLLLSHDLCHFLSLTGVW